MLKLAARLCALALLAVLSIAPAAAESADTVLLNGKIVTLAGPDAEAMAVRDGRIVAIGKTADIRALAGPKRSQVLIAGVPWPIYKLVALLAGLSVLLIVGIATGSAAPAVLSAAAVATVVWVVLGIAQRPRR